MQSTNVRQIKTALVEQAFHGTTQVSCPLGRVVGVSRWKGQLRVMIPGWGRWYPVESVRIEGAGAVLLQQQVFLLPPRAPARVIARTGDSPSVREAPQPDLLDDFERHPRDQVAIPQASLRYN